MVPALMAILMIAPLVALAIEPDKSAIAYASYAGSNWKVIFAEDRESQDWLNDETIVAKAVFDNAQNKSGWMYFEVVTKESATDDQQAQAAGYLEGYLTKTYITEAYKEFFANDVCKSSPDKCKWIKDQFRQNQNWVNDQHFANYETGANDPYWYQIALIESQMAGMKRGIIDRVREEKTSNPDQLDLFDYEMGVLLLNLQADFWDLSAQYDQLHSNGQDDSKPNPSKPSCSVIIKYLEDQNDILMAHNTWHEYRAMTYRMIKRYELNYHDQANSKIPGHTISMSSYAGSLASLDDFYLISSGLAATETSLFLYDNQLLANLSSTGVIYEPFRVMVANRLAKDAVSWQNTFKRHNSGTYNNQWMVVDFNKVKSGLKEGALVVSEQLPGLVIVKDQTKVLESQGYWASYNRAYYPEIFEKSGAVQKVEEFGDWFSYGATPRSSIFRREHHKVKDTESLMKLMRFNEYETDEFGAVEGCTPARIPAAAIANRLDLSDPDGNCTFGEFDYMVGHSPYGALGAKVASLASSFPSLEFNMVGGPFHDSRRPPFKWSTTNVKPVPEFRTIDEFNFHPVTFKKSVGVVSIKKAKAATKKAIKANASKSGKLSGRGFRSSSTSSEPPCAVVGLLIGCLIISISIAKSPSTLS